MEGEKIKDILLKRKNMKFKLIIQGIIIGLITGCIIVLNRLAITKLSPIFKSLYLWGDKSVIHMILVIAVIAILGIAVGLMVKDEGMISGSGIPQVKGRVVNKLKMNWLKILIYKFLGGVIALSTGLSLGREGPSVQIGASIGEGVAEKTSNKISVKSEFLITAGASAGLSAAFNAPLSGIVFALEEIHRSFSPLVLLGAMASAITADFVSKNFLGMKPVLDFSTMQPLPLNYYWMLVLLGILTGILGVTFSKGVYLFQNLYGKMKNVPVQFKVMIPFIITAIVGLISPIFLGGGHEMIMELADGRRHIGFLVLVYILKFILLLVCFGSSVPGGIFLPMLLLGAVIGNIVGVFSIDILNLVDNSFMINFIALGMAGYFVSVVKAPITGIILIIEMTGSFSHLLSLGIVVIIAYITSEILDSEPIYEVLLEKLLDRIGITHREKCGHKTILEFVVEMESIVEGRFISEIDWPKDCLLVAIKRGEKEIIPRGTVKLISGDYIVVLANIERQAYIIEDINHLTLV